MKHTRAARLHFPQAAPYALVGAFTVLALQGALLGTHAQAQAPPSAPPLPPAPQEESLSPFQNQQEFREELRTDMRESGRAAEQQLVENIAPGRQAFPTMLRLDRAIRVGQFFEHANLLLLAVINRLASIADKIEVRLDTLENQGGGTATAYDALLEARIAIDTAAIAVGEVGGIVSAASTANDPLATRAEIRMRTQEARAAIRAAYGALRATTDELKQGTAENVSEEGEGTGTPTYN